MNKDILLKIWDDDEDETAKIEYMYAPNITEVIERIHTLASENIKYSVYICTCIIDKS